MRLAMSLYSCTYYMIMNDFAFESRICNYIFNCGVNYSCDVRVGIKNQYKEYVTTTLNVQRHMRCPNSCIKTF